jgi:hypothetical protein
MVLQDHGYQNVVVASDYQSMIQRIASPSRGWSMAGSVDIKSLAGGFCSCSFKHLSPQFSSFFRTLGL